MKQEDQLPSGRQNNDEGGARTSRRRFLRQAGFVGIGAAAIAGIADITGLASAQAATSKRNAMSIRNARSREAIQSPDANCPPNCGNTGTTYWALDRGACACSPCDTDYWCMNCWGGGCGVVEVGGDYCVYNPSGAEYLLMLCSDMNYYGCVIE
jgi:hypothetical protein